MTDQRPADGPTMTIPAAAVDALLFAAGDPDFYGRDPALVVGLISAPVVAAELRRLVSGLCTNDALYLLARADELDGGA